MEVCRSCRLRRQDVSESDQTPYNSHMETEDTSTDTMDEKKPLQSSSGDVLKPIRQLVVFVLGMSVVVVGIAMIVLPGPATVVIPAGLAILATEFVWARRWLNYLKSRAQQAMEWTVRTVGPTREDESKTANQAEPQSDQASVPERQ